MKTTLLALTILDLTAALATVYDGRIDARTVVLLLSAFILAYASRGREDASTTNTNPE